MITAARQLCRRAKAWVDRGGHPGGGGDKGQGRLWGPGDLL